MALERLLGFTATATQIQGSTVRRQPATGCGETVAALTTAVLLESITVVATVCTAVRAPAPGYMETLRPSTGSGAKSPRVPGSLAVLPLAVMGCTEERTLQLPTLPP